MRGGEHVGMPQQPVVRRRLDAEHVEAGGRQPAAVEPLQERILVDDAAAAGVDQNAIGPQPGEDGSAVEAERLARLGQMQREHFRAGEKLGTVPTDAVRRAQNELGDHDKAVAEQIGARYLVTGSYVVQGTKVRVDLRLEDARGEVMLTHGETAAATELVDLAVRAGTRLRGKLGVADLSPDELATRVAAGTITELDGIGPSTGSVIGDAVRGTPSEYLDRLEAENLDRATFDSERGILDELEGANGGGG